MASGHTAGRFNLALAIGAAGATAFALFAMPEATLGTCLDAIGLSSLLARPVETGVRFGLMAATAGVAFLLAWLAHRSCDPHDRRTLTEEEEDDNWPLSLLVPGNETERAVPDADPDDPFSELARSAKRIEGPLEFGRTQIVASGIAPPIDDSGNAPLSPRELIARLPYPCPAQTGAADLVQLLNMGMVESEWPLPAGEKHEAADAMDDRLRNVLHDLKLMARRG
jgi:hypothetical protein